MIAAAPYCRFFAFALIHATAQTVRQTINAHHSEQSTTIFFAPFRAVFGAFSLS